MLSEVTVKVSKLLETLKENRENHIKEYEEAVAGYKEAASEKLTQARETAVKRMQVNFDKIQLEIDNFDPEEAQDYFTLVQQETVSLPVPKNYSESYDKTIAMLEWERGGEILLKSQEFDRYVLDNWEFTESFKAVSAMYMKG